MVELKTFHLRFVDDAELILVAYLCCKCGLKLLNLRIDFDFMCHHTANTRLEYIKEICVTLKCTFILVMC